MKTKREYKRELNSLIKEYSAVDARVKKMKINIKRYCSETQYRAVVNFKIKHFERKLEQTRRWQKSDRWKEVLRKWYQRTKESRREMVSNYQRRYREEHPWMVRRHFDRWAINNPRKAMLCAAASRMAMSVINRLWIRPTVCPHCGRETPNIDFHHPNHLFWWKWTFCCKSCHYYFNRDKVPASDKIIDLKQLLRESSSH